MTKEEKRHALEVAAALLLLQRRSKQGLRASVTAIGVPLLLRSPAARGEAIITTVTSRAIIAARTSARVSARGLSVLPSEIVNDTSGREASVDVDRSVRAGASLGRQWGVLLEEAEGDARAAATALGPRLERTAITEAMTAWNTETRDIGTRGHAAGLEIIETWHAMLDACDVCWDLDGETRTRPDEFDEYPTLHPHCCCFVTTSYEERDAA